jgi:hypothetical protein
MSLLFCAKHGSHAPACHRKPSMALQLLPLRPVLQRDLGRVEPVHVFRCCQQYGSPALPEAYDAAHGPVNISRVTGKLVATQ